MAGDQRLELQREVEGLLGQCLLRLQQYERLLKSMLVNQELGGPVSGWATAHAARVEEVSDKTLGTLVKRLFEAFVLVEASEQPARSSEARSLAQPSVKLRFSIAMTEENRATIKADVEELVLMRNDLVHHLAGRFDIGSQEGCVTAAEHLRKCYARIDRHYGELKQWARGMSAMRAEVASFVGSEAFEQDLLNGIAPDGAIHWERAGIVQALRDALQQLVASGWVRLEDARSWIAAHHPEQVPEKYGCRTWPQVLSESRAFRLEYRRDETGRKTAWYCLR